MFHLLKTNAYAYALVFVTKHRNINLLCCFPLRGIRAVNIIFDCMLDLIFSSRTYAKHHKLFFRFYAC